VQRDLPLAVRGGGHGFLGWGTCDDGLVIDTSAMKEIAIDPVNRTARAGAGVVARELVAAASPHDLVPVLGQCPTVGISGLTLGGGLGWLSGKHGATCDNLLSAELVTADGRRLVTSETEHPNLFWGIRGGGGNFGVATSFTFRLHPIGNVMAGTLSYRWADARRVLRTFGEVMEGAGDELQGRATLSHDGEPAIHISICWSGDPGEADAIVRPLRTIASPEADTIKRLSYLETFGMSEGVPRQFSAIKGSYLERLSPEAIDVVLDRLVRAPAPGVLIGLDHYMHGAVCRVASDSTAFDLRVPDALHVFLSAETDNAAAGPALSRWIDETWNALQPYAGGRVYANYPAAESEPVVKAAYGGNYARLVAVKNEYDPGNVFQRNYNIRPARA
jgi:FAD/FMN-containing dehydrogenase